MRQDDTSRWAFVIVNFFVLIEGKVIDSRSIEVQSSPARNVTKKPHIPVKEFSGKYLLDDMKTELTFQHKHVIIKRAAAVKRKNKDVDVTKKKLPRTTRVKSKWGGPYLLEMIVSFLILVFDLVTQWERYVIVKRLLTVHVLCTLYTKRLCYIIKQKTFIYLKGMFLSLK